MANEKEQTYKITESNPKKLVAAFKKSVGRADISVKDLADYIVKTQKELLLETPMAKYTFFEELAAQFKLTPAQHNALMSLMIEKEQEINGTIPLVAFTTGSLCQYYCLYVFINNRDMFNEHKNAILKAANCNEKDFTSTIVPAFEASKTIFLSEKDKAALLAKLSWWDRFLLRYIGQRNDHELALLLKDPITLKKRFRFLGLKKFIRPKKKAKKNQLKTWLNAVKKIFSHFDPKKLLLSKKKVETADKRLGLLLAYNECSICYRMNRLELLEKTLKKYNITPIEAPTEEKGIDQEILALQEKYEYKYNKLGFWDVITINAAFNKNPELERHLLAEIFELRKLLLSEKEKPVRAKKTPENINEINSQWTELYKNEEQKDLINEKTRSISIISQPIEKDSFTKTHKTLEKEFLALFEQPQIIEQDWKKATDLAQETYSLYKGLFKPSSSKEKAFASKREAATFSLLNTIVTKIEENSSSDIPKKEYQITSIADGDRNSTRLTEEQKAKLTAETIKKRLPHTPRMRTI